MVVDNSLRDPENGRGNGGAGAVVCTLRSKYVGFSRMAMKLAERTPPFAIEDWIVDPDFHQLSRGSSICTLEPRVMSVLLQLAAHPQRVISKDEFLRAVWPDTFVGEDALTRCISILRHALNDDPHHPRFIKTVPKAGYCLLVSTRSLGLEPPSSEQIPSAARAAPEAPRTSTRSNLGVIIGVGAATLVAITIAIFLARQRHGDPIPSVIPTFQLTTDAGEQSRPAVSPDGKRLAFVWAKEDGSHQHIYIKQLGSESLLRLTDLPDDEYSPVWSPDGRAIAFLSSSPAGLALYVASLDSAHAPDKVYIPGETTRWEQGALAWSPDGKSLVLADHLGAEPSSSIYRIDLDTRRARPLTSPPSGWEGDLSPAFSPDGRKIAFLRASENSVLDVYWIPSSGGQPQQITHDGQMIDGITWSSDNRSIIFSSNRAGEYGLYKIALNGRTPQRMPVGTENATQPAIPRDGKNLAFVQGSAIFGILEVSVARNETAAKDSMMVSSTAQDSAPSISPDGSHFAFQSWRSGTQQIWISSFDGQSLRQLTPTTGDLTGSGSPSWSPSGRDILFDSRIRGHSHIFIIPAAGGTPTQITFADANDIVPRWSVDGRTIYFRSNRGGRWQLWKLPASGGEPQPVSRDDGMVAQESADGKWLYFARGGENGIWRMPASGGEEVRILDQPLAGYWGYWAVGRSGIYFLDQTQATPAISIYDPSTAKTSTFAKLNRVPPLNSGIALLGSGRTLLISDKHDAGSHISIAQGVF
jgi:Tol biopolymer transport system component/DNA-binding winged helix-turn-helix (wHTH) protein